MQRKFRPVTQIGLLKFYNLIEDSSFDFVDNNNLSVTEKFNKFLTLLQNSYIEAFPFKTYKVRSDEPGSNSWFNEDLKYMRNHLKFLYEVSKQYKQPADIQIYKSYKKVYNNAIKSAKIANNDKIIKTSKNPIRAMWKIINKHRKIITKDECSPTVSPNDFNIYFSSIAQILVDSTSSDDLNPMLNLQNKMPPTSTFNFQQFSFNEVRDILNNIKNKSSCDIFGLSVKLLKVIKNLIVIPLTKLINSCVQSNSFPDILKKAVVVPVFKKGDKHDVSNYRPISLLPAISKVVEKCMAVRLTTFFEQHSITSSQFGFRAGKNTTLGILNLISDILDGFNNFQYTAVLFCDLTKAFDCVSHNILLRKLHYYNFSPDSIELIRSYLKNRSQIVRIAGVASEERVLNIGVPQGSVLGLFSF
nr:unnamed protein product [Callosobruchus analis]